MNNLEIIERVVALDVTSKNNEKLFVEIKEMIGRLEEKHDARLNALEHSLSRYKGAWGLLFIIGSSLATVWTLAGDFIRAKIFGNPHNG